MQQHRHQRPPTHASPTRRRPRADTIALSRVPARERLVQMMGVEVVRFQEDSTAL